ncbi:MAG: NPCBM/NEW2 domain-containing protein [Pirellulaceae bacterium]
MLPKSPSKMYHSLIVLVLGAICQTAIAAPPNSDEMIKAKGWVAARFLGVPEPAPLASGMTVVANYGVVQKNGRGDRALRIADVEYARGLYCHAPSQISVRLPQGAKVFTAVIGVDSNAQTRPGRGSVVFSLASGGQEVFRSEPIHEGIAGVPIRVDLQGSREFVLQVDDAGDGNSCDQADWADAKLELADGQTVWLGELAMLDASGALPDSAPPFSFVYAGRPSSELLGGWQLTRQTRQLDEQRTEHVVTYRDPESGLVVRCVAVAYEDFPTVEWTLYLQNAGTADSPLLQDIQALDITLRRGPGSEFALHHLRGDSCTPDSYEPSTTILEPNIQKRFSPAGGRPTNGAWPYWNIQWGMQGMIASLGWPGQWAAEFARDAGDALHVRGGQELTHFSLHPGEEVRTPLVVLQFYAGDRVGSQNVWRKWMLTHNIPRTDGHAPPPMFTSCSGGFFPGLKCNETDEFTFIDTLTQHGIKLDYWWMDAGWYPCDAWPQVGTWQVDASRFPRGLKAISDHVHAQGTKLILWFEPERVAPNSWLYDTHPEWLLGPDGGTKLLNLGNATGRAWLIEHIDALLAQEGIDLYRQDFNMDPLEYWRAADTPDRQGITEIRHVEGYLAYWDELQRRRPGMLIDSCASGGRRNDLETLRRAVPLLRSDYQSFAGDPNYALGNQCHTYGLSSWIPYYGQGTYYNPDELVYSVRSHYCPAFGFCVDVRREGTDWAQFGRLVDEWRALAPCLLGDFYPLTPYSLADDAWIAWQFHVAETGAGVVQVFRRPKSFYSAVQFKLRGLDPAASYELTNMDVPGTTVLTGRELAEVGLPVAIDRQPAAVVIKYQAVVPASHSGR